MVLPLFLPQHYHSQCIHHPGNIYSFRAPRCALKARGTEPKGIHLKRLFFQTKERISNDLVWSDFHGKGNWTSRRTISTLITGEEVLSTYQFHLLCKFIVNLLPRQFNFHCPSPTPSPHRSTELTPKPSPTRGEGNKMVFIKSPSP